MQKSPIIEWLSGGFQKIAEMLKFSSSAAKNGASVEIPSDTGGLGAHWNFEGFRARRRIAIIAVLRRHDAIAVAVFGLNRRRRIGIVAVLSRYDAVTIGVLVAVIG